MPPTWAAHATSWLSHEVILARYAFPLYSWVLFAACALSVFVLLILWPRRRAPGALGLVLLECAIIVWTFAEALDIGAVQLETKILWSTISYPGVALAPFFFFYFITSYAEPDRHRSRRSWAANAAIPVLTILVAATNNWHHLLWPTITLDPRLNVAIYGHGPWWWLFFAYSYSLLLRAFIVLGNSIARYHAFFRTQNMALFLASILPILGNLLYAFRLTPIEGMDWTPVGFTFSSLVLTWILFQYRMLDLVPVARDRLVDTLREAVLVLDERGRIVDANPALHAVLAPATGRIIGQPAALALASRQELVRQLQQDSPGQVEIALGEGDQRRTYDLRITQLRDQQKRLAGRLVVLHDITRRKRLLEERDQLIAELQRALTEVKTLSGLLPICANCKKIRDDLGYWRSVEDYVGAHTEVEFTHGICPDCMNKLYPDLDEHPEETTTFHDEDEAHD
jgi:PAS domain-containing protein